MLIQQISVLFMHEDILLLSLQALHFMPNYPQIFTENIHFIFLKEKLLKY